MKVVFDHKIFTMQKYGGVSRYIANLAHSLQQLDINAKIIAPLHINNYLNEISSDIVVGKNVGYSKRFLNNLLSKANNLLTPLFLRDFNPDIVHESYYASTPIINSSAKRIITIHDMIHEIFPKIFKK